MFVRIKRSSNRRYITDSLKLQREKKVKQRTIATLGRIVRLEVNGKIDFLMRDQCIINVT